MNFSKPALTAFLLLFSVALFSQATITGELQKWHTVAITFDGPNTSENNNTNPFLDYRLNVTFSSPTGKTFVVPGFYAADGNAAETSSNSGNKWRVRFTPNETGQWSYTTSFRTGSNVAISDNANAGSPTSFNGNSGNFNISGSSKSGIDNRAKGRLNYVGERYLKFEETGKYFLKAGSDSPENLLAYNDFDNTVAKKTWSPHAQDWNSGDPTWKGSNGKELIGAINYLSEKGMNAFSFLTMNVIGDGKDVWPWTASSNNNLDGNSGTDANNRLRYDVSKLAQWEILFSHADSKGMYLHFKTQETENDQLLDGGNLGTQRKLYYRELIARFGHHLALNWNLGEEHDLYQELNDSQNTRVKQYASYIKATDPYDQHIVIHSYPGTNTQNALYNPLLGNASELTGPSVQTNINNVHQDVKRWIIASKNAGKQWVVANDEQGGANAGVTADASYNGSKGNQADNRKDTRHKVLWGTLMAGGAGVEYYFGYQTGETDLTAQDFRSRNLKWNDAKIALDFFNSNLSFWEMETNDGLTSNNSDFCLAKVNDTYAIYLPNGGSTNLNLSNVNGSFTVKWFNPINGGNLVNGSVTQINGGGNRSIGNPPNNTSSDWVALVQKGEATDPQNNDNCEIALNATSDFDTINVSGFSPAYIDNAQNALAINAAQHKDKFAAAQTTFSGETGTYDITLTTLTEIDGESTYRVAVNGTVVGTYQNPESSTDYTSAGTTFENITIPKGAQVRVEFSSNTNGKIAEGNGTAYSRGRWTSISFTCEDGTPPPPPPSGDCDADYEEKNGLLVMEAENLSSATGWVNSTAVNGFTGNGYIDWQGANSFGNPGNGTITTKIKINTPGTYLFQWRSKVGEGTNSTESNDSWLRFPDADDFFGQKGNGIVYPKGSGKTPTPEGAGSGGWFKVYLSGTTNWTWSSNTSDNDAHKIYVKFNAAGVYTMEVSGRSKHHLIDRIVMSKDFNNPTNLSLGETECTGDTPTVSVTSVSVSPQMVSLEEGSITTLTAQVSPSNASNKNVTWSSNNTTIATVDQNGRVTAMKEGNIVITVTTDDGDFTSTAAIEVTAKPEGDIAVTGVQVTPQSASVEEGKTLSLTVEVSPSNATNKNISWSSSDTTIATVNANGLITAIKIGSVTITTTSEDGGFTNTVSITITEKNEDSIAVSGIYVTPQQVVLEGGATQQLSYQIRPSNATNTNVVWRSTDESIVIVDSNGLVTGLKKGTAKVEAQTEDGGFISDATVRVTSDNIEVISVTDIEINPETAELDEGESLTLEYAITPANATNKNVDKPDETVAVSGVSVTPENVDLENSDTVQLSYQISPANATNKNIVWSSSDITIATVNQNGLVATLKEGEVSITVTTADGGFTSVSKINITDEPSESVSVTRVYVTPQRVTLDEGETVQLSYEISPSNATNKNVVWSSSDTGVATVDENGLVTAIEKGTVEIEALTVDGGLRSDATIEVIAPVVDDSIAVTGIILTPESASIEEGSTLTLSIAIAPSNATNKNVTWFSGDTTIATVNQNGSVTALKEGEVSITATTSDGGFTSNSSITVTPKEDVDVPTVAVRGIYVTPQKITLEENETVALSFQIRPTNATNIS